MGAVVAVAFDHHCFVVVQTDPPAFQFDVGQQQGLVAFVDGAFDQPDRHVIQRLPQRFADTIQALS